MHRVIIEEVSADGASKLQVYEQIVKGLDVPALVQHIQQLKPKRTRRPRAQSGTEQK